MNNPLENQDVYLEDNEDVTLTGFLQQMANVDTRDINKVDVATKAQSDVQLQINLQNTTANKTKTQLKQYKALTQAMNKANTLVDFAPADDKKVKIQDDEIDSLLNKAKLVEKPVKRKQSNFAEESSSDDEPVDVNDIIMNQSKIKESNIEILRLRAVLLTNQQKLKQWAKIKSRKFRKIHNKEQKQRKMQELAQKLQKYGQAAEILGMDDYCNELFQQQEQLETQINVENVRMKTGEVKADGEPKGVLALKFMQKVLQNPSESSDEEVVDGELKRKVKLRQNQSYTKTERKNQVNTYDENPFLDEVDVQPIKSTEKSKKIAEQILTKFEQQKQEKLEKEQKELEKFNYDPENVNKFLEKQQIQKIQTQLAFEDDQIQQQKDQENQSKAKVEDQLDGWGGWAGAGLTQKEAEKRTFKQQIQQQQRINKIIEANEKRSDKDKSWLFVSEQQNEAQLQKYAAKGLKVTDEEYARYLKQHITPEFQSVSSFKYMTQKERHIPRGLIINQQRQMEENIKELEKIQKTLEEQKVYIKGERQTNRKQKF